MHNRDDLFIKALLVTALSRAAKAETEVEVVPAGAQRIDVYSVPDPALAGELGEMGMLGVIAAEPSMIEAFSDTLGMREMRALFRKQLVWHHELERRARVAAGDVKSEDAEPPAEPPEPVPFPAIVTLSPGKPETVIAAYGFEAVSLGLYAAPPGLAASIVVMSELPVTRATVLLRLAAEKLRAKAVAEILRMPDDAWERKTAEPLLVHFEFVPSARATPEETMNIAEIQQQVEESRQRLQRRGKREVLLKQLRIRFGELPEAAVARVEAAEPDELEVWVERVLTAKDLHEVFGDS
jgi:hypothetical protein